MVVSIYDSEFLQSVSYKSADVHCLRAVCEAVVFYFGDDEHVIEHLEQLVTGGAYELER